MSATVYRPDVTAPTGADVAAFLGRPYVAGSAEADGLDMAAATADEWAAVELGHDTLAAGTVPARPAGLPQREAVLGMAADLWRLGTATFGYFPAGDDVAGIIGTDLARRWRPLLTQGRRLAAGWGIA
jgi:hypothetical protein